MRGHVILNYSSSQVSGAEHHQEYLEKIYIRPKILLRNYYFLNNSTSSAVVFLQPRQKVLQHIFRHPFSITFTYLWETQVLPCVLCFTSDIDMNNTMNVPHRHCWSSYFVPACSHTQKLNLSLHMIFGHYSGVQCWYLWEKQGQLFTEAVQQQDRLSSFWGNVEWHTEIFVGYQESSVVLLLLCWVLSTFLLLWTSRDLDVFHVHPE